MKFEADVDFTTNVQCKLIECYPEENRWVVGYKYDNDQSVRSISIDKDIANPDATEMTNLTLALSRVLVKAIKQDSNIDKNANTIAPIFWGVTE